MTLVLCRFLCYLHLPRWRGDRARAKVQLECNRLKLAALVPRLELQVLVGGGAPPVDPNVVTKLPRALPLEPSEGEEVPDKAGLARCRCQMHAHIMTTES